jgi:hypothetical protein
MESGIRKDVARRVWIILCSFECCSLLCILAMNALTTMTYIKLVNLQQMVDAPEELDDLDLVLTAWLLSILAWFTFIYPFVCWGSMCQLRTRLQLFSVAAFVGDGMWALIIVAIICRGFHISPDSCDDSVYRSIHHLQVSLKGFWGFVHANQVLDGNDFFRHHNLLHLIPRTYYVNDIFSRGVLCSSTLRSDISVFRHPSRIRRTRAERKGRLETRTRRRLFSWEEFQR